MPIPWLPLVSVFILLLVAKSPAAMSIQQGKSFRLLLETPVVLRKLEEIVSRYDIFLLDQFGVLHNGAQALPGAVDAVQMLLARNKTVVVVSNTSQRKDFAVRRFAALGFPTQGIDFVTSGESCWEHLLQKEKGSSSPLKAFVFGWHKPELTANFLLGLRLESASLADADCLLFHGPETCGPERQPIQLSLQGGMSPLAEQSLRAAAQRGLPAYCANIDMAARMQEELQPMPGVLRRQYEALGGQVQCFGKPLAACFDAALGLALQRRQEQHSVPGETLELARNGDGALNLPRPGIKRLRAIHVGDSLEHDIDGAAVARIDSLLVTEHGIHKDELTEAPAASQGYGVGAGDNGALLADPPAWLPCANSDGEGKANRAGQREAGPSLLRLVTGLAEREGHAAPTFIIREFL